MAEGVQGAPGPSKKAKRECHYLNDWQTHGISRSGKNFGFCKLCGTHINNISHGGVSDVRKI